MAGYNGFSMSNNAVQAYRKGLVPASKVGCGIPVALIRKYCRSAEWHHTSMHYNETDFFDPAYVKRVFGLLGPNVPEYDATAAAALQGHKKSKDKGTVYTDCRVEWLDWSAGTMKRPRCEELSSEGCKVVIKGETAYVTFADGSSMTKRLSTKGFKYIPNYTKWLADAPRRAAKAAREEARAAKEQAKKSSREAKARYKKDAASLQHVLKARGAKAQQEVCDQLSYSGNAWAALSKDGKKVLAIRLMHKDNVYDFKKYREICREELAKIGIVASGYIHKPHRVFEICSRDLELFPQRSYAIPEHLDNNGRPIPEDYVKIPVDLLEECTDGLGLAVLDDNQKVLAIVQPLEDDHDYSGEAWDRAAQQLAKTGRVFKCYIEHDKRIAHLLSLS
jgi:hypothetical protein